MKLKKARDHASKDTPVPVIPPTHHRILQKPTFKRTPSKTQVRRPAPVFLPDMTELIEFLNTHEEAFRSRNRLASLYADFREQQQTNPEGYAANLNAWKKALEHAARAGVIPASGAGRNLLIIDTGNELARALQHKDYGLPTCLRDVFQDAIKKKAFVPVQEWMTSTGSIYQKSWFQLPNVSVGGIIYGALEMGKNTVFGPPTQPPVGSFVVVANVETAAEAILNQYRSQPHTSTADRVISKTAFRKRFGEALNPDIPITARDLDVLLVHMVRDRQALSESGNVVKFKADTEDRPPPITQEDAAIVELRDAIEKSQARMNLLQVTAAKNDLGAREAVQLKQMVRAKACLRSKKLAESALEHTTNVCLQLEESYMKLQQAVDHVGMLEAMKAGAEAMALLNKKVGGAEGVQKVVDSVNEEIATTEEITNIINESAAPIDEGEIDDEFAELERAEKEKKEREEATETAKLLDELSETKKEQKEEDRETTEVSSQLSTLHVEPEEAEKEEQTPMVA